MTPAKLDAYVRFKTKRNTSSLTSDELTSMFNIWQGIFAEKIAELDEDLLVIPATTDLVADQREYPAPNDCIKIKYVEAQLDGTNWVVLKEVDLAQSKLPTDETTITNNYSNEDGDAFIDLYRKSFVIYSGEITNVTGGLKIHYAAYPPELNDLSGTSDLSIPLTSTSTALPRQIHKHIADLLVIEIKESSDKPMALSQREQLVEARIRDAEDLIRGMNLDQEILLSPPDVTARMEDDGFNL